MSQALLSLACIILLVVLGAPAATAQTPPCPSPDEAPLGLVVCHAPFNSNPIICKWTGNGGDCQSASSAISCEGVPFCVPTSPAWLSLETKDKLKSYATLLGASAALTATYVKYCAGAPLCPLWLGGVASIQGVAGAVLFLVAAVDPEDLNYDAIAVVVPEPYTPVYADCLYPGQTACVLTLGHAGLVNADLDNMAWIVGIGRAMATTADRATTAWRAGDQTAVALQDAAMAGFQIEWGRRFALAARVQALLGRQLLQGTPLPIKDAMAAMYGDPATQQLLTELSTEVLP
jgi:hypothetical protein